MVIMSLFCFSEYGTKANKRGMGESDKSNNMGAINSNFADYNEKKIIKNNHKWIMSKICFCAVII